MNTLVPHFRELEQDQHDQLQDETARLSRAVERKD